MNKWVAAHLAVILAGAATEVPTGRIGIGTNQNWADVLFTALATMLAIVALVWFQTKNPMQAKPWRVPRWTSNPFGILQPLLSFHLAGWFFIGAGLADLAIWLVTRHGTFAGASFLLVLGLSGQLAVKVCVFYFDEMFATSSLALDDGT